jgi:hypothetical protein
LALSAPTIENSGTDTVTATVTAVDANRNAVTGIPVTLSVDSDATVQVTSTSTDATGVVTGTVRIGANKSNRTILVTATSGALSRQLSLQVIGTRITATALPASLAPSQAGSVEYRVVDATSNPMPGVGITVTGPGGVQTTAQTGINGDYVYSYTAPAAAVNFDIRASAAGVENVVTVVVQAGPGAIPPATAGSVRSATLSANPLVVPVNQAGSNVNRAEMRALFVGINNAPIPNVRVRFDLDGDPNSIGGSFTSGTSLVYRDANGVATTAYVPGTRASAPGGVTARACWDYNDFAAGTCPNAARVSLTVNADPLSVAIGTDELIVLEDLVYVKRFVVQVNDSSGLAKQDVAVSPLLDLRRYQKGQYFKIGDSWTKVAPITSCDNEDLNRNGVAEDFVPGAAGGEEDANGNGQLDPRKADVVVAFEGSNRTDATGRVTLRVVYPRNFGSWVEFALTVSAGVSGSEGRATFAGTLPVPASAIKADGAPAFVTSPYGVAASATTIVTIPGSNPPISGALCTNSN